jgi:protocatechuate 3,4-dioxygenase beta subunit
VAHAEVVIVAQRIIEMLIGRLITDEEFRSEFLKDPEKTLTELNDRGMDLSRTEVAALVNTDPTLWARTADAVDPRLQKASFKNVVRIP